MCTIICVSWLQTHKRWAVRVQTDKWTEGQMPDGRCQFSLQLQTLNFSKTVRSNTLSSEMEKRTLLPSWLNSWDDKMLKICFLIKVCSHTLPLGNSGGENLSANSWRKSANIFRLTSRDETGHFWSLFEEAMQGDTRVFSRDATGPWISLAHEFPLFASYITWLVSVSVRGLFNWSTSDLFCLPGWSPWRTSWLKTKLAQPVLSAGFLVTSELPCLFATCWSEQHSSHPHILTHKKWILQSRIKVLYTGVNVICMQPKIVYCKKTSFQKLKY